MIAFPQLSGRTRPSSPGTTRSPAKSVAMPPAEERSSEPSASPIRVTPTRYATLPHRARVTPGSESAAVGPFPSRMAWERKNAAKTEAVISTAETTTRTSVLAQSTGSRWGTADIVVRIIPEECSPDMNSTPVSYTHLRAHETRHDLVCRLLLEKKKKQ